MSWLNTGSRHVCGIAVLGENHRLPWDAAKILFQHQRDFNYLEFRHLWEDAAVTGDGVQIAGMTYPAVVLDGFNAFPPQALAALQEIARSGRLIAWNCHPKELESAGLISVGGEADFLHRLDDLAPSDVRTAEYQPDLRFRHVIKESLHYYIFVNEGLKPLHTQITVRACGMTAWLDPYEATIAPVAGSTDLALQPYSAKILVCSG